MHDARDAIAQAMSVATRRRARRATTNGALTVVQATNVTWLEIPNPDAVQAACMDLLKEHPGSTVMMSWVNSAVLAVFVAGADDDE